MSSENDVPLGEESRRYYENQFGDRIRQVSKPGAAPKTDSNNSNWGGKAGAGLIIGIVFVVIRIVLFAARTDSSTPSYTYTPPKPVFDADLQKRLNEIIAEGNLNNAPPREDPPFDALLDQLKEKHNPELKEEDVPFLEGLCFRIHQESQQAEATPGGRIWKFLDASGRKALVKAAKGQPLAEDDRDNLLEQLSTMLEEPEFSNDPAFRNAPALAAMRQHGKRPVGGVALQQYNRVLLESCYPEQIIPLRERNLLNDQGREQWAKLARADHEKAKKEQAKR